MWNPEQYHRYSDERSRPFYELLAQVRLDDPRVIADLGCGSGELTAVLAQRWPSARIYGVDNSAEMLAAAQPHTIAGRLTFAHGDLATWSPPAPLDLLFSNAALHWVPEHHQLLPHLVGLLAPAGVLAFQVPGNFDQPTHTILAELRTSPRWAAQVGNGVVRSGSVQSLAWYFELLTGLGMRMDAWDTTYLHVLQGEDAVLDWVKGTALRPVIAALDEAEQVEFIAEYAARLRDAYPRRDYGTLLPFRRLFVVAEKILDFGLGLRGCGWICT